MPVGQAPPMREFEVAVGRKTLCEPSWNAVLCPKDQQSEPTKIPQTNSLPRTAGCVDLIVKCLHSAPLSSRLRIAIPDLNIVHYISSPSTSEIDDEHLLRLSNEIQAVGGRARLELERAADFGRLRLSSGETAAKARISAVEASAFFFYPSPHPSCQDAWEVRFLDKTNPEEAACTYERFLDWGEAEVLRYIDIAVKLGRSDRLQPSRLALEDPGMFWQVCFRFAKSFPRLAQVGQRWGESLEEGLQTASKCGKTAAGGMPTFGRKMEKAIQSGGEAARMELATSGSAYGMLRVAERAGKSTKLRMEMDEELQDHEFFSAFNQVLTDPSAVFAKQLSASGLAIGMRVVIGGLSKAPQYNGQTATIRALDSAAMRVEVELASDARKLKVRLENLANAAEAEAGSGRGSLTGKLQGACRVCSACSAVEAAPGIFKSCQACRAAYYCGKECQVKDWKAGGHKRVCGKGAAAMREAGVVEFVVLPCAQDAYPYVKTARGGFEEQMQVICVQTLGCSDPGAVKRLQIQRGEASDMVGVVLLCNASGESAAARGNARASALTVSPGTMLQLDEAGQLSAVRGDAVLVRMAGAAVGGGRWAESVPPRLEHCGMDVYARNFGNFSMFQIPSVGVLTSFFGKTPEGEAAQAEMLKVLKQTIEGGQADG